MNRKEILHKLEAILDEAERLKTYGTIELQLRAGAVELIRTSKTEIMQKGETRGREYPHSR